METRYAVNVSRKRVLQMVGPNSTLEVTATRFEIQFPTITTLNSYFQLGVGSGALAWSR